MGMSLSGPTMEPRKQAIIDALYKFIGQRAGMEPGNYGSWKDYRSEQRSVTRDLHDARTLLGQVSWRDSITADALIAAAKSAYSGRLTIKETGKGVRLEYCTGQYFPTEYRKAVCALCASALWYHTRDSIPNEGENGKSPGDLIRGHFRREFGARMARRWFD